MSVADPLPAPLPVIVIAVSTDIGATITLPLSPAAVLRKSLIEKLALDLIKAFCSALVGVFAVEVLAAAADECASGALITLPA